MTSPVYVLDTHCLVWFVKGHGRKLGLSTLLNLQNPHAKIVIPSFALEEIQGKFNPKMQSNKDAIKIPPTALLRLVIKCSNVRVLTRGPSVLAREFQLKNRQRQNDIPAQDVAIAAAVLVVRQSYSGPVLLLTRDFRLKAWAIRNGVTIQRLSG
jgi:PIN domain nuclease of toxin-antitoxin system